MSPALPEWHEWVAGLRASHERLDNLVRRLDAETLVLGSYCDDWNVAQVLSHLGSGAEITMLMIEEAVGGAPAGNEARDEIWARWDSKAPQEQAADFQIADERLVHRFETLRPDEVGRFRGKLGPLELSAPEAAAMRLSEHVLHGWDVQVALEPDALLPMDAAGLLLTWVGRMAGMAAKADRWTREPVRLRVELTEPGATLLLEIGKQVEITAPGNVGAVDGELVMAAEAFIRLVYGRLDPEHTPGSVTATGSVGLGELREVFPGF